MTTLGVFLLYVGAVGLVVSVFVWLWDTLCESIEDARWSSYQAALSEGESVQVELTRKPSHRPCEQFLSAPSESADTGTLHRIYLATDQEMRGVYDQMREESA